MENKRDEWRSWVDTTLRGHDLSYERLGNRVHNAETIANEARAEFRAIRQEIKEELRALHIALEGDAAGHPGIRQDLAALKNSQERRDRQEGFHWTFRGIIWPVVITQTVVILGLLLTSWDHIRAYVVLHEHIHQVAVIERHTKKLKAQRSRRRDPPPPPVVDEEPATGKEQ